MWWHYLIGYGFSVLVGHILISPLINVLWIHLGWKKHGEKSSLIRRTQHPMMIGILERFLYTASWQFGKPEFIGVWLVLKAAGGWKAWTEDREVNGKKVVGRDIFNVFLIGSGFSIAYGTIGAFLIKWLKEELCVYLFVVPSVLIVVTLLFWIYGKILLKEANKQESKNK